MASYRVIGTDGREYGPVSPDLLRGWIGEGRVNARTQVCAEGSPDWAALGSLPEFRSFVTPGMQRLSGRAPVHPGYRHANGWAISGFICGLLSVVLGCCCCCCMPIDLFGIVCSVIALVQISRNPETQSGTALAIIGLILSLLSFITGFVFSALWMAGGGMEEFVQEWDGEFSFGMRPLPGL